MKSVSSKVFSSLGQAHEFELVLAKLGIIENDIQQVIQGEKTVQFIKSQISHLSLLSDWQTFWSDMGSKCNILNLKIPTKQKGFDRLIVDVPDVSIDQIYEHCKKLFDCWKWTNKNLSEVVYYYGRIADDRPYAVWFRDCVEADEELKNISAYDLNRKGIPSITLKERLIYELKVFLEINSHLDYRNITLCAGSCCDANGVPGMNFKNGEVHINWYNPYKAGDDFRSRFAVL